MLRWILIAAGAIVVLTLLLALAGQLGLLRGKLPTDLGVNEGKLKRPSKTPNSVSSQAELWPEHPQLEYARIAPLALVGDGPATLARLRRIVEATPGAQVLQARADYLQATFSTPLMKYTDDVEFWFDPTAGVVQVRSASRLGQRDFGANRARIEALRAKLAGPG